MRTILLFVALVICSGGQMRAETAMPDVPAGLVKDNTVDCRDITTKENGQCVQEHDANGNKYIVFKQEGVIQFIRQITPNGYTDIWMRDSFGTY